MNSVARCSALALALAAGPAAAATATTLRDHGSRDAAARIAEGLRFIERVLHIQQHGAQVSSFTISIGSREASLELDLAGGGTRVVVLKAGGLFVDNQSAGQYSVGGALEHSWRRLLADAGSFDTPQLVAALKAWKVDGLTGEDLAVKRRIDEVLSPLAAAPAVAASARTVAPAESAAPPAPSGPTLPAIPAPALEAAPPAAAPVAPSAIQILFHDVKNVVAMFIALAMVGFGTVFFARRYLEVVADTASQAFGRSLVVGLLGQLLLFPTLAMLIVGLIFTIVGILLLPFAIPAFVIAACLAVLGGYLAVAHAVGETVSRRRMANGAFVRSPNAYGYLFTGLIGLLGLWAAAALFGWAGPVVYVFRAAAFVVTWLAATVGFGAVLLSRAGLRDTFTGRHMGDQSGEYLWTTPPATPAAPRPGRGR
ncbi:MAG TPA: hypothetical protein VEG33_19000 [Streptosporangiaceae bacterium]|nr:hypothetical protein [Streptosporangiaceae bacterium]